MLRLSKSSGIGGRIKEKPEDFLVMEITGKGITLEPGRTYSAENLKEQPVAAGRFTTFVLRKTNWETTNALISIAKKLGRGRKSIGYAGSKDKVSVSVQLASIFGAEPQQLQAVGLKDISVQGAWKSNGVELGSNLGNAFDIRIKEISKGITEGHIARIIQELGGRIPNYYDKQRFGSRLNNASIGACIIKGDMEGAVMELLTNTEGERNSDAIQARKRLQERRDFSEALGYFPRYLKIERAVISYMSRYNNYSNAIRMVPRGIAIMFIHALESLIFNTALENRIREHDFSSGICCGADFYGFPDLSAQASSGAYPLAPIIGYNTGDDYITGYEKETMERIGITKEDFKIRHMPELGMKGAFRPLVAPVKNFSFKLIDDSSALEAKFSIPAGSYATILIDELTKSNDLDMAQILSRIEKQAYKP